MSLSEATALAPLEVRAHEEHEDLDQLCELAEQAQQFSPIVGLEQLDKQIWAGRHLQQPESLLLDVTGLASFFGGEEQLLFQVAQWLESQNLLGSLAIGGSIGAAWAMANYANRKSNREPRPTQQTRPDLSRIVIPVGQDSQAISNLPVAALRLEAGTVQALFRLGIRTIRELEQLPRAGMATRLGQTLLDRWDQAIGQKAEPLITLHAQPEWQIEQTLENPTEHREHIAELIRRHSSELTKRLAKRGQGALRVVCRLDLVDVAPLVMQLGLFRPTCDAEHLQLLLCGQLEQQFHERTAGPLWRLSLQATMTAPLVWQQADLFEGDALANRQQIARLVDNLSSRLGRRQVLRVKVERESQPEQTFTQRPMTGRRTDGKEQVTLKKISSRLARKRAEPSPEDPLRRPTRLFASPQAIDVVALAPDGLPARFRYQQQAFVIIKHWGPERLESGWWRGPSVRREYFRVETEHGAWWWIFRNLNSHQWFLHGVFD